MKRRTFFQGATAAAPFLQAAQVGNRPSLKITDVKLHLIGAGGRNYCIVRVETDQGITGIGEAYSCGPDAAIIEVVKDFRGWLIGQDPRNIEHLYSMMVNFTRFPGGLVVNAAISGIEHALWDVAGKAAGLPVYMLLGGKCRDKIRVYQSAGNPETAKRLVEKYGYTAIKMRPQPDGDNTKPYNEITRGAAGRVKAMRDALGPDVDIGCDIHARFFEVTRASRLAAAIAPYNPMWLEEPIRPENEHAMKKLADRVTIPLASGECNYQRHEFRRLLELQALDIIQPDICLCGGLLEMKKIAAMAEAHYVTVAPHNPMGPVATAVNVHFAASTSNFFILEYHPDDEGVRKDVLKEPLMVKDGYIPLPTKPGLGIELNEDAIRKYPPVTWHRGFAYRADGSVGYI
ncbi:MAG TPA: galactonate dehydratase [Bryobacteraceae bacterium]|nr:galactonate dehydratase [Bryobacteraceae bacterium]